MKSRPQEQDRATKPDHSEPTDAEVRAFGHLAQDIAYLRRGCGLVVAPFKDGFRIGTDVVGGRRTARSCRS